MKSKIRTVDVLLSKEKIFPIENRPASEIEGIAIKILGFKNVQSKEHIQRPISKIINLLTIIND